MKRFAIVVLRRYPDHRRLWAAQSPLAEFKVTVKTTDRGAGFKITCERGCAWKELSYGCGDGKAECTAMVDAKGVGGVRP